MTHTNTWRPALVATLCLIAPCSAAGDNVPTVERLTVHADGITLTRHLQVPAVTGPFHMLVDDLPAGTDPASVRVSGAGGIDGLTVSWPAVEPPEEAVVLADIEDTLTALAIEREGLMRQLAWLERVGPAAAMGAAAPQRAFSETGDFVLTRHARIARDLSRIARQSRRLQDERSRQRDADAARREGAGRPRLRIAGVRRGGRGGHVVLAYGRRSTGWAPRYDLRLGEHPSEARLTLSAAMGPTRLPAMRARRFAVETRSMNASNARGVRSSIDVRLARAAAAEPVSRTALELAAIDGRVEPKAFNEAALEPADVALEADAEVLLPEGSGPARITVFERPVRIARRLVLTPASSTIAHAEVHLTNTTEHVLMEGSLALTGEAAGNVRGTLPTLAPGDGTVVSIGTDSRIRMESTLVERSEADDGAHRRITVTFRAAIHNHGDRARIVHLRARHPVGDKDNPVAVSDIIPATVAGRELERDQAAGLLEWRLEIPPGVGRDATVFEYGYRLVLDRNFVMVPAG